MQEWLAFSAGSVALAYVSRASLRAPRSHGFYRFLSWELMLVIFVRNMDVSTAALAPAHIASGVLLALSLFLALMGYLSLLQLGRPDQSRNDSPLLEFEKTTALVTGGIYARIRHPMYASLILLDWGLFFRDATWLHGGIALAACALLVVATLAEEQENIGYFGERYREYMRRSKRFIPYMV